MVREWKVEWMKTRYRGIGWIVLAFFGLIVLWSFWALHDIPRSQAEDGFRMLFMQIPLIISRIISEQVSLFSSNIRSPSMPPLATTATRLSCSTHFFISAQSSLSSSITKTLFMLLRPSCFCAGISRLLGIFWYQPQAAEFCHAWYTVFLAQLLYPSF